MQRSPAAGGPKWRRLLVLDRRSAAPSPGRPPGEEGPGAAPGRKGIRGRAPGRAWTPPCITTAFPSRSRPLSWESSLLPARRAIVCDCELSSSDHVYKWDPGTKHTLTDRVTGTRFWFRRIRPRTPRTKHMLGVRLHRVLLYFLISLENI